MGDLTALNVAEAATDVGRRVVAEMSRLGYVGAIAFSVRRVGIVRRLPGILRPLLGSEPIPALRHDLHETIEL